MDLDLWCMSYIFLISFFFSFFFLSLSLGFFCVLPLSCFFLYKPKKTRHEIMKDIESINWIHHEWIFVTFDVFIVPEYGERVYADLQPHLHDAPHRPLVRLPPVSCPNAPGFPSQQLGGHQWTPGRTMILIGNRCCPIISHGRPAEKHNACGGDLRLPPLIITLWWPKNKSDSRTTE